MLSLLSIVLTFLALTIIPALFISWRLNVPLSFTNILSFIKIIASKHDDDEKISTMEEIKKGGGPIPKHVAIIMDGNRRWAKKRGLGPSEGQEAGTRSLLENTTACYTMGINTVSLFAFSTENWRRPEDEVTFLMDLFERYLKCMEPELHRNKIKVSVIGRRTNFPETLLDAIRGAEEATKSYEGRLLILALDYSGKYDILQACKSLAEKAKNGLIQVEDIDEKAIDKELMTNCTKFPNPDLLIRTSGEHRISNFFLWQSAYSELYFSYVLWPDFGNADILKALTWYQSRQRRFGRL